MLAFFVAFGVNAQKSNSTLTAAKVANKRVFVNTGGDSHSSAYFQKGVDFSDDFEGGDLSNFTVINGGDANGFVWQDTGGHNAPGCATISFSSDAHDDWIITPALAVIDGSYFKFQTKNQSDYFVEQFDVMLSTAGTAPADFTTTLEASVAPGIAYEEKAYDLSSFAGQNVYIGIHITTTNQWRLYLDEFEFGTPDPHDLGVTAVTPTFVLSGSTVTPQVTIHNYGTSDEATWSVELTDGTYDNTVSDAATITAGGDYVIDFPDYSPADGTYTLTATVTVTGDANAANDVLAVEGIAGNYSNAYGGNTDVGIYNEVRIGDGLLDSVGIIGSSPFPMAEEYNGTYVYRVYNDMTFGTVAPNGTFTELGTLTGFTGTPTGLAWDRDNSVMYVMMLDGSSLPNLCTLDLGTFALTQVGSAGTAMIIGIDFADDGYIYGPALNDESLYQYDPADGTETLIGSTGLGLNYGQDVSFDYVTKKLYTINSGDQFTYGTYDLATGAFTQIADMGTQYGTFVITNDTTPVYSVTFNCNINDSITSGYFVPGTDTLSVTGDLGDLAFWTEPGSNPSLFMTDADNDGIYTISMNLPAGNYEYKYFKNAGWANGEWNGGDNRTFSVVAADTTLNDWFGDINSHVGINEISSEGISVYPNPSNGVFNINVENNYNLEVFDITGRVINTRTLTGNTSIELNTSGVYFLRFSNEKGSFTQKVIVQ